jgi:Amt family ammonium transporter
VRTPKVLKLVAGAGAATTLSLLMASGTALAQDAPEPGSADYTQAILDNVWVVVAACLVFFMQAGFALVEAGLTRAKSVVNILAKNTSDMIIGGLAFFAVGYAFAFGGGNKILGTEGFFLSGLDKFAIGGSGVINLTVPTFFFFQVVFAGTAVTITSGALAERTKFVAYLTWSAFMCTLIYPVVVHWTWGGGLIAQISIGDAIQYSDFAGSGVVHLVGGVAAAVGALVVGPRIGRYGPDGKPRAIPGHNIAFAMIGVFILWLGWFGFNPGSELAADTFVMWVALNTLLAAIAGGFATTVVVALMNKGKIDLSMVGNGILGGLVGITAGCGTVNQFGAIVIGLVSGIIIPFSVAFLDRIKLDDPVGAVSVHGTCGVWGLLGIGLFARYDDAFLGRDKAGLFYGGGFDQLAVQALMALIIIAYVAVASFIVFTLIKYTIGLRVSEEVERQGLDIHEHGIEGYAPDVVG